MIGLDEKARVSLACLHTKSREQSRTGCNDVAQAGGGTERGGTTRLPLPRSRLNESVNQSTDQHLRDNN